MCLIDKPHHPNFLEGRFFDELADIAPTFCRLLDTHGFTMSMITAAQWVPRGFAAPFPQKYTLDETEYERIAGLAKLQLDDAEEDLKEAQEAGEETSNGKQDGADDKMEDDDESPKKQKCASRF